jgi:hypothetical protein
MTKAGSHTTNYLETLIAVAPDCPAVRGTAPPSRDEPSVAERTFRMIHDHPYRYTSDDVIFTVWADRNGIVQKDRPKARAAFFSKPQPCLRASDLGKKYGWGIHADGHGRIALIGVETAEYQAFATGARGVAIKIAMRSSRK